ncbi:MULTISPECIES: hypothetical protein [Paenibacillus]|uniref:Uncharacterized protein n=1 Tax=Paenibacillus violae TaxID=3077234 RepID=A0ABU3RC62_9BACL|nr:MULTISPECIES: hypothetical protein [Paenibacillus]MDU0201417.1 hypothetical protein [Paenibacillus sp. PFR10]MEC0269349.1 hypothetical protein [Paenibacillus anseongense]
MGCNNLSEGYKQTAAMLRKLAAEKTSKIKEIEQQEERFLVNKMNFRCCRLTGE